MADVMKLFDPSSAQYVEFSPISGYTKPDLFERVEYTTPGGTLYTYKKYKLSKYEVPVNNINTTDYGKILGWWQVRQILKFYADMINAPTIWEYVKIINEESPLRLFNHQYYNANSVYAGTLIMLEDTPDLLDAI